MGFGESRAFGRPLLLLLSPPPPPPRLLLPLLLLLLLLLLYYYHDFLLTWQRRFKGAHLESRKTEGSVRVGSACQFSRV